eukprot:CAMPEP_0201552848 /NCGR_PEP_ID=MMETSP0173_2-20130828/18585_1 /ASSEMBLY_ACC=CAM_ASM_000268 /TAXON_ID=218659 /ORGANISM="Vexillifera sp., Strain DIVA3 564/2" /LENGTH=219 /DNA_ID=CAMNT_0047963409 /DNA_START=23 /DNA_END=682 /DNA_ORIENTATION=+
MKAASSSSFSNQKDMFSPDWLHSEHDMGTSIMAVKFKDGVVIGADSRTSTGSYVANRVSDKLTAVSDSIYCCRSGSAADTQAIADMVRYNLELHSLEAGEAPEVSVAANFFQQLVYNNKDALSASIICAGYDKYEGGSVYSIPLGGVKVKQNWTIGGSGSTFIYGHCDEQYRENMTKQECLAFVRGALKRAVSRDGSSGGVIRTAVITKAGVEREVVVA